MDHTTEIRLRPGGTLRLTAEGAPPDTWIHVMGLQGKLLLTGGAELVDAIPGTDWDPQARITGHDDAKPSQADQDPALEPLRKLVLAEVERFFGLYMERPTLAVISLDYRHLRLTRLCGMTIAYGHQPPDDVRCACQL